MGRWGIRADRVFDGERVLQRPTVLLEDDRVVAAGASLPASIPVEVLDGRTVMPGLVDCHQHLVFDGRGTLEAQVVEASDAELAARAGRAARRALEGGVTTLRDLGDRAFVTLDLRARDDLADVVAAGPPITPPGGHCWYLGGECAAGVEDMRQAVRRRAERGVDVVKIMVTGGAMTPSYPLWSLQFTAEEVHAAVDEAHARGLPVAAHCHGVDGIELAVDARVDSIEHCSFFDDRMEFAASPALLERIASSGIAVSATLGATSPIPYPPVWAAAVPSMRRAFGAVHDAGGVVVIGTDAGINQLKPHDVLPYGLSQLVEEVGMSGLDALRAVTSRAGELCGRPDAGRLRSGGPADLVAVRGDPVGDPAAMTRVERVWKSGREVGTARPRR